MVLHKTIIIAQYLLGAFGSKPDLSHDDRKPEDGGCTKKLGLQPRMPATFPRRQAPRAAGKKPGPATAPLGGPPVTRRAATARLVADPSGVRGARRLQTRPAPSPRRLPAADRRLRAPSRLSPRRGREGPGGEAGAALRGGGEAGEDGDGAAIVPQPLPGARDGLAGRGGKAGRARSPGAAPRPRPPPPAARAAFVTVSSPSEPARRRRCAPGCKWRPLASAPLTARPARGRLRHGTPGCIPPSPLPGGQIRRHRRPRLRPWRGSRAGPGSPDAPPALRPRRPQPLTAGRGAPAGRAHGLGEDSWSSAGEMPPLEAVPLRPKTSSPNVRETKGIC